MNISKCFACKCSPFNGVQKPLWGELWKMSTEFRQVNRIALRIDLNKS
jgi:hypothetical protein